MDARTLARSTRAYGDRAVEYATAFGSVDAAAPEDRALISAWADSCRGRILDAGCGPGQWTTYLARRGLDVEGMDPVPAFIDHARRTFPKGAFRIGSFADLPSHRDTYAGVLSWYSTIHLDPLDLPEVLAAFRERLEVGGQLLLGFFRGEQIARFDHAVTPAYCWPVGQLTVLVERAGFRVESTEQRTSPGARDHGAIRARSI